MSDHSDALLVRIGLLSSSLVSERERGRAAFERILARQTRTREDHDNLVRMSRRDGLPEMKMGGLPAPESAGFQELKTRLDASEAALVAHSDELQAARKLQSLYDAEKDRATVLQRRVDDLGNELAREQSRHAELQAVVQEHIDRGHDQFNSLASVLGNEVSSSDFIPPSANRTQPTLRGPEE